MNKWQRLAMAFPLVMQLIEDAEKLRTLTGQAKEDAIVDLIDGVVNTVETAVGKDLVNNQALRDAIENALNVYPPQ